MLSYKTYFISVLVAGLLGAGIHSYINRGRSETTDVTKEHQVAHDTKKITVVITAPDGKKTTTETTEIDTHISTEVKKSVDTKLLPKPPKINFSGLVGTDINHKFEPLYGISVSKEVIGPVTTGFWVISNGTIGISLGVNF